MKKTSLVLGIVALLGAAYVGTSWYVGKQAQVSISHAVTQTNERAVKMLGPDLNSAHFNIEIRQYERGVFSSSAQYVIHTLDSDGKALEYILQDDLQHGPFPLAALRSGEFVPMLAYSQADMVVTPAVQEWFDAQQGQGPLTIETQIGFGGEGTSNWTFAPFQISREQRDISFSGGHLNVVFRDDFNNNVATGHFDAYALTDGVTGEKLEIRDISLNSTTHVVADQHIDHRSTAQVKTLTLVGTPDTSPIELGDLSMTLSSTQKGDLLDAQLRYDIARTLVGNEDLGQMTAAGSIAQLNIKALYDLQLTYAAMAEQRGPGTEPGFLLTEDEQLVLQDKMRPILAAAPTLSLEPVVLKNSAGQSEASVFITLRDPGELDSANAVQMLQKMIANAKLAFSVDRALIVELFKQVGANEGTDQSQAGELGGQLFDDYAALLTRLGIMQLQDNTLSLTLDATPAKDQIVLNGETMTTEQLMVLALGLLFMY